MNPPHLCLLEQMSMQQTWQPEQMDSQLLNLSSEARTKIPTDTNDFSLFCVYAWESTQTVQVHPGTCSDLNNV